MMLSSFSKTTVSNRPIILFGGGIYGEIAYRVITGIYHASVQAIVDNKVREVPWADIPVKRSAELARYRNADVLICAANAFGELCKEVGQLNGQGVRMYDLRGMLNEYMQYANTCKEQTETFCLWGEIDLQDIVMRYCFFAGEENGYQDKLTLPYCVLCITSKCSLRCKNCAAFITRYNPQKDYTFAELKRNLGTLLEAVDGITELELMGGEPFLHTEFDVILQWCIEQVKIRAVKIISNGTIVPKDHTWNLLKNHKVKLVLDDYGSLSGSLDKLTKLSQNYKVRYEVQKLQTWYQLEPVLKKGFSEDNLEQIYQGCTFRTCLGVTNGRFYHCNVSGHMNTTGLITDEESDFIQLEGKEWEPAKLRETIKKFLKIKYLRSCDYCNYYSKKEIEVAEQVKPDYEGV